MYKIKINYSHKRDYIAANKHGNEVTGHYARYCSNQYFNGFYATFTIDFTPSFLFPNFW